MSSLVTEFRPVDGGQDKDAVRAHPRGQGFRVLSRIARVHAEADATPRHRREDSAEALVRPAV